MRRRRCTILNSKDLIPTITNQVRWFKEPRIPRIYVPSNLCNWTHHTPMLSMYGIDAYIDPRSTTPGRFSAVLQSHGSCLTLLSPPPPLRPQHSSGAEAFQGDTTELSHGAHQSPSRGGLKNPTLRLSQEPVPQYPKRNPSSTIPVRYPSWVLFHWLPLLVLTWKRDISDPTGPFRRRKRRGRREPGRRPTGPGRGPTGRSHYSNAKANAMSINPPTP